MPGGYLSELHWASYLKDFHFSFYFSLISSKFLAAAANLSSALCYRPRQSFLPHAEGPPLLWRRCSPLHLYSFLFAFLSFHAEVMIYYSHSHDGKPVDSPACSDFFLTSSVSRLFERIFVSRLLFFLGSNYIFSRFQVGFRSVSSTISQIFYPLIHFGWV